MKRRFILNLFARGSSKAVNLNEVKNRFKSDFDCVTPKSWNEAVLATRDALVDGCDQIIALGGDGTLNAVVNGFFKNSRPINPEASLAVSHWGTGSDYFRMIAKMTGKSNWLDWIERGPTRTVDVGHIHFESEKYEDRFFINIASVGLNGLVAQLKNKSPSWIPTQLAYVVPVVQGLLTRQALRANIVTRSKTFEANLLTMTIALGHYAGAGMKFGGKVELGSGNFDVKFIEDLPLPLLLKEFPKLYLGGLENSPAIKSLICPQLSIKTEPHFPVEFDGEVYGESPIEVQVIPKALRIVFPF